MKTRKTGKTVLKLLVLVGFLSFLAVAIAGDLQPPGAPDSTMKTLDEVESRIPIPASDTPAAQFTISESGSYYLTGNRLASGTGIRVESNDVTIDLNGFSLIGPSSGGNYGVYMVNLSNVEIRNGTIRNFGSSGIYAIGSGSEGHILIDLCSKENGSKGFSLAGSGHLVKNCSAVNNANDGINVGNSSTVVNNIANANGNIGIYVGDGSVLRGNIADNNGANGLYTNTGCLVIGNTSYFNQNWGIYLAGNSLVMHNTVYDNAQSGSYGNMNACGTCTLNTNHAP